MTHLSIVASNIKNGGGKELLVYLLEYIEENYNDLSVVAYLDVSLNDIEETDTRKIVLLNRIIDKIRLFNRSIDNAIYFGNLPPLKKSQNSIVYFHNPYLLMPFKSLIKTSFMLFIKYTLQRYYIKIFIQNIETVACQNQEVKESFIATYGFKNVRLLPFFRLCDNQLNTVNTKIYDFCYVSLAHPHKNHIKLLDAFEILSNKNIAVSLALTVEDGHDEIVTKIEKLNEKGVVSVINLGLLPKRDVCTLYAQSKSLVFPSTQETFGLALIEAVNMNLDIIASDLEYVYKAVIPSLVFNPNDSKDIADKLIQYIKGNSKKSESIIDNKIQDLINIMIEEK